jgi:hypothetical protein
MVLKENNQKNMITTEYKKEEGILEVIYDGKITIDDLLDYGKKIRTNETFPRNLKILTDATRANYTLSKEDISHLIERLERDIQNYNTVKSAFIHKSPRETALSMILEHEERISKYSHKIFSTREAAISWLKED